MRRMCTPAIWLLLGYGHVALGATIEGNDYGFVEPATVTKSLAAKVSCA
jgi:hypothetical protein